MQIDYEKLALQAREVSRRAYARYSRFPVGAALLADDGRVFVGCNVENISFGLTICAERSALCRAVAEGATRFAAIAIYTPTEIPTPPCGACRQVLAEFAPDLPVYLACASDQTRRTTLARLLPESFRVELPPPDDRR